MDLSIIIPSYNTKKLTVESIKSIVKAKPKLKYEIIVVDNNSSDGSIEALKSLKFKSVSLILITNKSNVGFSKANNQGITKSKGKYKLLLNSDTIIKKRSLEDIVAFAQTKPSAGVVGSRLLNKDGSVQASVFHFPTVQRAIRQYWLGKGKELTKYAPKGDKPIKVDAVVGAAFLITPQALKKVGLLNERYFMFFEDIDYCREVRRVGLSTYYYPTSTIVHLHGESGKTVAKSKEQWKRLIPSSKTYHGPLKHYTITFILWSGQKFLGRK